MSVKSVAASFVSFLAHHVADLTALDTALSGILAAVPVNAETRAHIQDAIDRVRDSAVNVGNAVSAFGDAIGGDSGGEMPHAAVIKRSDIDAAVADVLPAAIADYMAAHPTPVDPTGPEAGANAALNLSTGGERAADASEETGRSQAGETGSGDTAADAGAFAGDTTA